MINYFLFFLLVLTFHAYLFKFSNEIAVIFLISILIKLSLILINNNFFYLMDGNADALNFHEIMLEYLMLSKPFIFVEGLNDVYALSQLGGLIYSIFGEDIIYMQLISLSVSSTALIIFYNCLKELNFKHHIIILSCLIFVIHPFLLNYSILTMREVYSVLILLIILLCFLKYFNSKNPVFIVLSFLPFIFIYFINGGLIVAYFVFFFFILKPNFSNKNKKFLSIFIYFILFSSVSLIFLYILIDTLNVPYLRNVKELIFDLNPDRIIVSQEYIQLKESSNANYPLFLISNGNLVDFIFKSILRYFYFLFSPFPWDISSYKQIFGLLDPFIHLFFVLLIYKNFSLIIKNEKLLFILVLYFILTLTYSFGVANFSQGIRHKTKFVPLLMLISCPFYFKYLKGLFFSLGFNRNLTRIDREKK